MWSGTASRQQHAISHSLVSIARGETPALAREVAADPEEFLGAVRFHRLAPLAHVLLRDSQPALGHLLRPDRDRAAAMHLHVTTLLGHVGDLLDGVPWAVFKGPVLSELAHPVVGLRSYKDLDLLVAAGDLRTVSTRLREAGWTVADFDDMLRNPQAPGEMHWRSPSGVLVDLHWSMINMAERRRTLAVPTEQLLARRVPIRLGFSTGWTLDPEDGFIHVCLHAALTGANRLLYLVDAQRMAARVTDWGEVGRRARAWKVAPHVCLVLLRARDTLGGDLPEEMGRTLPMSWAFRALTAGVGRLAPVDRARQEPGLARLVARAVAPGAARTAAGSSRSVVRHVLVRRPPVPGDRVLADDRALELYLARVEAAAGPGC
ncbi:nucleotidyltransferase family protein [Ruania suaedae]|uniref:nucleotidyltransferase family protein n=1 Tax=Ruania suaedae TaxID=2897774 RepID=UPI001E3CD280|nr:nucleotidyltransferase family protein [Ruania suaedae]UFU02402.1 nucleotidyltransferase family protein [Ruania suaedae]